MNWIGCLSCVNICRILPLSVRPRWRVRSISLCRYSPKRAPGPLIVTLILRLLGLKVASQHRQSCGSASCGNFPATIDQFPRRSVVGIVYGKLPRVAATADGDVPWVACRRVFTALDLGDFGRNRIGYDLTRLSALPAWLQTLVKRRFGVCALPVVAGVRVPVCELNPCDIRNRGGRISPTPFAVASFLRYHPARPPHAAIKPVPVSNESLFGFEPS